MDAYGRHRYIVVIPLHSAIIMDECTMYLDAEARPESKREDISMSMHDHSMSSAAGYTLIAGMRRAERRCLVSVTSPLRMKWDALIMILAIWNVFYVPFAVAFFPEKDNFLLIIVDLLIDSAYILDIAVYARSTYIDSATGEEVTNAWKIVENYFTSGKLTIDALSAIPFDVVTLTTASHEELQLFTLSKIVRLLRLSKIIMFMQTKAHIKLKLKFTQLCFIFVAYVHFVACMWFLLTNENKKYTPPALYLMEHQHLFEESTTRKYAYSLYMSVYMLTAAEIGARTQWERIFAGAALLTGQLFQAYMFGEIAVVLFNLNKKSEEIASIQNAVVTTMINMKLTVHLKFKVSAFLMENQGSFTEQRESEEFFRLLPPSLLQEVRGFVFEHVMTLNPAISGHEQVARSVLKRLKSLYCRPEEHIIAQGDDATALYFISSGKCSAWVTDEHKVPHRSRTLGLGAHFGEIALLFSTKRTATIVANTYATLAVLEKDDFAFICHRYPKAKVLFRETAIMYHDGWKRFVKATLRRCPIFKSLHSKLLSEVMYRLPIDRLDANSYIYKEGEYAEKIVFVLDGNVEVYLPVNDARLLFPVSESFTKEQITMTNRCKFKRNSLQNLKRVRKGRYLAKVAIDDLGRGSVLCSNLCLLNKRLNLYAKATQPTVLMTLTGTQLESFCTEFPEIRNSVNSQLALLRFQHPLSTLRKLQMTALDYEKSFENEEKNKEIHLWYAKMKVRRCALGKMIEKRTLRAKGFPDLFTLSQRLRAILEAEKNGDFEMVEKIRRGVLPTSAERIYPALRLLQISEVEKPILTQFALEAVRVSDFNTDLRNGLIRLNSRSIALTRALESTHFQLRKNQQLLLLLLRLLRARALSISPS